MRRVAVVISLLGAPSAAWAAPEVLTLDKVLELVRTESPVVAAARAGAQSADAEVRRAWTAWQPRVDAIGQLQFSSVEQVVDFGALVEPMGRVLLGPSFMLTAQQRAGLPEATVVQPYVSIAGVLSLKQTLFNITALRAPGVADAARDAARAGVVAAEDEASFAAAQLYVALAGLGGIEAAAARAIEVSDKRIKDARAQLEAGTTTQLNVTRAETDRIAAESQLLAVRSQRRTLAAKLAALLGRSEPVEVSAAPIESQVELVVADEAAPRATVRAAAAAEHAAERAVTLHEQEWLPTLAAEGNLRYSNVSGFSGDNFVATAALNLVIPLYDSGVRYAAHDAAAATAIRARAERRRVELDADAAKLEADARLDSATAELALAEARLRTASEAVVQVESLASAGLATDLELADADRVRFTADSALAQQRFALDVAKIQRVYARGGRLVGKGARPTP